MKKIENCSIADVSRAHSGDTWCISAFMLHFVIFFVSLRLNLQNIMSNTEQTEISDMTIECKEKDFNMNKQVKYPCPFSSSWLSRSKDLSWSLWTGLWIISHFSLSSLC